eukprot:TRINITY_DN1259_c3_g2_i2.p1 TRINITY_DN1259_c3_g2~~TRINITY_DN1259_c3_g2_i2.p1  ORF type:complete len:340 (+),score=75.84 TRINITY_DN1259_c3_g2_i2:180-1199(+)
MSEPEPAKKRKKENGKREVSSHTHTRTHPPRPPIILFCLFFKIKKGNYPLPFACSWQSPTVGAKRQQQQKKKEGKKAAGMPHTGYGSSPESTPAPSDGCCSPESSPCAAPIAPDVADAVCFEGSRLSIVGGSLENLTVLQRHGGGAQITTLDVSANSLVSLNGLQLLPRLQTLVLDNNRLSTLDGMPELRELNTLWLNNNRIDDLDVVLEVLAAKAPAVKYLSLLGNSACRGPLSGCTKEDSERYRAYVLHKLPQLQLLDAAPVTAAERKLAAERGQYYKVVRTVDRLGAAAAEPNKFFEKGQKAGDRSGEHSSYFGKQRRFYSGKYSEGNRFIRDNAL